MSIANAEQEDLIPLNQAIRTEIPGLPSASTVWRWIVHGLAPANAGEPRIRLAVLYVGNRAFTTRVAIREFIEKSSQARLSRMTRSQQRVADVSHEELAEVGLVNPRR